MKTNFSKQKRYKVLSIILTFILAFNMLAINVNASTKTNWFFEHWHDEKDEWVTGLARGYGENDYVPHVIDARNFVHTGEPIKVELDYKEYKNGIPTIGYDEASGFFIGPLRNGTVPVTSGSAITVDSETPIDDIPVWYLPSSSTFTVSGPVVDTSVKPHVIRYTLTPASGTAGDAFLAELDALGSGPYNGWAMYFVGHLSLTGSQNRVSASADPESGGKTIVQGSSYYPGASLHTNAAAAGSGKMDLQLQAPKGVALSQLTIDKSTTTASFDEAGDVINYTITVQNTGDTILTDVTVTDNLIATLTQTIGNDNDGEMSVGEIWTYTGIYTVDQDDVDAGRVDNTATADSDETGPVSDSVTVEGIKNPELSINKSTTSEGFDEAGDIINYTITVQNTGNITLTGVTVNDPLLGTLTQTVGDDDDGTMSVGEIWTYIGSYIVDQDDVDAGRVDNTATADSKETDPVTDSVIVRGEFFRELTIDKSTTTKNFEKAGDIINYTITVQNTGYVTLTGVTVSDPLLVVLTQTVGNDDDGIMSVGEIWTYTGTYTVDQGDIEAERVDNTAIADSAETEPVDDSVTVPLKEKEQPTYEYVMLITKEANVNEYSKVGDEIVYTIKLVNDGDKELTNIIVTDPMLGTLTGPSGDVNENGKLDLTETWTYTGTYTVKQSDIDAKEIVNTAKADSAETEPVEDSVTIPVKETEQPTYEYVMIITKEANVNEYSRVGDEIVYTIKLVNDGDKELTNIIVTDPMLGTLTGPSGDVNENGKLDLTETWIYTGTYIVKQSDIDAKEIVNTATADSAETTHVNDSVTVDYDEPGNPPTDNSRYRMTIEKDADVTEYSSVGDVINYTITLENTGNRALTGVKVTDPMLDDLEGPEGDTDNDNVLDTDETWTYTGSYIVTAADMEKDSITNTAEADSNQTSTVEDSVTVDREEDEDTEIVPTEVPLGGEPQVPEIIEEQPVPQATLPNTGRFFNTTMLAVIGSMLLLTGLALNRKKRIKE